MDGNEPSRVERPRPDVLGVLGGMGPLATVDFFTKLVQLTPAERDPDHIPVIVSCEPQIPSRPAAYFDRIANPSPLPALKVRRDRLVAAGARCIVIPCNTAHYWFDDLTADSPVPFIHIVQATAEELDRRGARGAVLGLIGTEPTLHGKLFEAPLAARGYRCLCAGTAVMERLVRPGINFVKANRTAEAEPLFRSAIESLIGEGAQIVVLGCTEVPAGLPMADPWVRDRTIDPTEALARAAFNWAMGERTKAAL
ncbi:MAG: aspartate/glutamate racemase family protein [Alphaproteobacteria bacterium]